MPVIIHTIITVADRSHYTSQGGTNGKTGDDRRHGAAFAAKLRKAGVRSTNDLLKKGSTPAGRKKISGDSGISGKLILEWTNHADLFRITGVGEEYADLLEEAGVDTVVELAKRKPDKLLETMCVVNEKKKLVRALPALSRVKAWVSQAKKLPRIIRY